MKVKRNTLLLIACLVWCAAGFNIFRIGFWAYSSYITIWNLLMSGVVFAVFYSGLGASLFFAGILFGRNYGRAIFTAATVQNNIKNNKENV